MTRPCLSLSCDICHDSWTRLTPRFFLNHPWSANVLVIPVSMPDSAHGEQCKRWRQQMCDMYRLRDPRAARRHQPHSLVQGRLHHLQLQRHPVPRRARPYQRPLHPPHPCHSGHFTPSPNSPEKPPWVVTGLINSRSILLTLATQVTSPPAPTPLEILFSL